MLRIFTVALALALALPAVAQGVRNPPQVAYMVTTTTDAAVAGNFAVTGAPFKPKSLIAICVIDSSAKVGMGMARSGAQASASNYHNIAADQWEASTLTFCVLEQSAGNQTYLTVASYDQGGVTLTKNVSGTGATGTLRVILMLFP